MRNLIIQKYVTYNILLNGSYHWSCCSGVTPLILFPLYNVYLSSNFIMTKYIHTDAWLLASAVQCVFLNYVLHRICIHYPYDINQKFTTFRLNNTSFQIWCIRLCLYNLYNNYSLHLIIKSFLNKYFTLKEDIFGEVEEV